MAHLIEQTCAAVARDGGAALIPHVGQKDLGEQGDVIPLLPLLLMFSIETQQSPI
jgi:hypothetical protein